MLLCRGPLVKKWLKLTRNKQVNLAERYGVRPAYISQLIHNKCPISGNFAGFLCHETKMKFEDLFIWVPGKDTRKFYGEEILCEDQFMNNEAYTFFIDNQLKEISFDKQIEKV